MNLPMFKMIMVRMSMAILLSLIFLISASYALGQIGQGVRHPHTISGTFTIIYLVPNRADEWDADIKGSDRYMCQPDGQEIPPGWRIISNEIKRNWVECGNKIDELVKQESNAPVPPKPVETQPVSKTPEPEKTATKTPAALDAEAVSALIENLKAGLTEFTNARMTSPRSPKSGRPATIWPVSRNSASSNCCSKTLNRSLPTKRSEGLSGTNGILTKPSLRRMLPHL